MKIRNKVKGIVIAGAMLSIIGSNICFAYAYPYKNETLQRYKHNSYTETVVKQTNKKNTQIAVKSLEGTSKACVWIARGGSSHADASEFYTFREGTTKSVHITDEKYQKVGSKVCTGRENIENNSQAARISFSVNYDF